MEKMTERERERVREPGRRMGRQKENDGGMKDSATDRRRQGKADTGRDLGGVGDAGVGQEGTGTRKKGDACPRARDSPQLPFLAPHGEMYNSDASLSFSLPPSLPPPSSSVAPVTRLSSI